MTDLDTKALEAAAPFVFDRYVDGALMAQGVTIERETTLEKAMLTAVRIAPRSRGTTVLVLRTPSRNDILEEAARVADAAADQHEEEAPFEDTDDYRERKLVYAKHIRRVAAAIRALVKP